MSTPESESAPLWLGQPLKNGARAGDYLWLEWATGGQACVWFVGDGDNLCVVDWCPISEVDAKTRAWIASISQLAFTRGEHYEHCVFCNGVGQMTIVPETAEQKAGLDAIEAREQEAADAQRELLEAGERLRESLCHNYGGFVLYACRSYDVAALRVKGAGK